MALFIFLDLATLFRTAAAVYLYFWICNRMEAKNVTKCNKANVDDESDHINRFFLHWWVYEKDLGLVQSDYINQVITLSSFYCTSHSFRIIGVILVSISSTIYEQLLCTQIPKAQKRLSSQAVFCTFGICKHKSCS